VQYIKVIWHHEDPETPVLLFSELDSERNENRKIEIYADGRRGFADLKEEFGGTFIGTAPVPPLKEIAADPQFVPSEINAEEFEREWLARRSHVR